jgi:DoxX-like family
MESTIAANAASLSGTKPSRGRLITSWIITGLITAFLLLDVAIKFIQPKGVTAAFARTGWPLHLSVTLGVLLLVSTIVWLIPRTAVLGAILLTGYLGGAVATNLRLENPLFTNTLFPVYFGVLIWLALWLRDSAIQELIPLRKAR